MSRIALVLLAAALVVPFSARAQDAPANPIIQSLVGLHGLTSGNILKTAEMLDEELYAFRPTEDVRTAGQILAHIANAQFFICSTAAGVENPSEENYEETATTKEAIIAALQAGFGFCGEVYAGMDDASGAEMREFFGGQMAASVVMAFNSTHNYEHYGNLVTYMRMNGIVPPSSQQ